jgi:hypothetical protein
MSFTRLPHDCCAYRHHVIESIRPGEYMLDTSPAQHCKPCFVPSANVRLQKVGASQCPWQQRVDVDSELMGLTRKLSHCAHKMHVKSIRNACDTANEDECNALDPENTRLSNPPCTLRGSGWQRWETPCQDPQAHVERPFAFNVSNRLLVKDNHRPCIGKIETEYTPPSEFWDTWRA